MLLNKPIVVITLVLCTGHRVSSWVLRYDPSSMTHGKASTSQRWHHKLFVSMDTEPLDSSGLSKRISSRLSSAKAVLAQHHAVSPTGRTLPGFRSEDSLRPTGSHGMPWKESIDQQYSFSYKEARYRQPFYMSFWEYQMSFLQTFLHDLKPIAVKSCSDTDMSFRATDKVRIHTCAFESKEYSRIRMTLLDGGNQTQVFTSLFYPRANLPVFGIDLLQFGGSRHLCVMDFQPIHGSEKDHACDYEQVLADVREKYPLLQNPMTRRFYDETQYFSKNFLLGREHGPDGYDMVWQQVFPAFQECLSAHLALVKHAASEVAGHASHELAYRGQAAYDTYSAERDPAHAMLAKTFGQEWADNYVYDVLFPNADRNSA